MADSPAFVEAVWTGPFVGEIPGVVGSVSPGDVVEVPEGNLASAHWQRKGAADKSESVPMGGSTVDASQSGESQVAPADTPLEAPEMAPEASAVEGPAE